MKSKYVVEAFALICALAASLLAQAAVVSDAGAQPPPMYVLGNFCSTCDQVGTHNQLFDDGQHGDGAANDGVWGADITVDKPAGEYFFYYNRYATHPSVISDYPITYACAPTMTARLWTTETGDVVHFRLGGAHTNPSGTIHLPGDWFPDYAMSSDHSIPPGASIGFRLVTFGVPTRSWLVPATRVGSIWTAVWSIPEELAGQSSLGGIYWVDASPGAFFRYSYNAFCFYWDEDPKPQWHAESGIPLQFEFDESTGQFRSIKLVPTPARRTSWGTIKALYR